MGYLIIAVFFFWPLASVQVENYIINKFLSNTNELADQTTVDAKFVCQPV